MKLSKQQLARLKDYQTFRHTPLTLGSILTRSWRWLAITMCMGGFGLWLGLAESSTFGWVLLGFVIGGIFCIFIAATGSVQSWPMLAEIIRWERVDELVRENEKIDG